MQENSNKQVNAFRRILPQFLAATIKNLHFAEVGLSLAMPSIVIAALSGFYNQHNTNEYLKIDAVQASWIGSIQYFVQPVGSLLSGPITDRIGRKLSMILVNIPFALGWFLLYQASAVWQILFGFGLLGIAVGLMEASVVVYVGEISEPSVRGLLLGYSSVFGTIGSFFVFILNTLMPWRSTALVCLTVPVVSAIALCFVPETPQWLLSKNRVDHAEKSLCWLRGWVPAETVAQELQYLQHHSKRSKSCDLCNKQNLECSHPLPTLRDKLFDLRQKRVLKPFAVVVPLFFLIQFSSVLPMRPFVVQIFKAYESPLPPDECAAILGFLDNIAQLTFIFLVRFTGKRKLYLLVTTGVFLSTFIISVYGFIVLPNGFNSFDQESYSFHLENKNLAYPLISLICLFAWEFFSYCNFISMPWILLSEIFPLKTRALASGCSISLNYIFGFISKKAYFNMETTLSLPGITSFYCGVCGVGLIYAYFTLPETENRSLEDIESHFSDDSKGITDRNIIKTINLDSEPKNCEKL